MKKLIQNGNAYTIVNPKAFQNDNRFKDETIDRVFDFAYSMTFGEGEHRDHRTGGTLARKKGQIFANTLQGKLAELAIYNLFRATNKEAYSQLSSPDFSVYGLGVWDDCDIVLGDIKFSIKSTKHYGNLLLLETKDWNAKGEYIPNLNRDKNSKYDYFVLVRIKPDSEGLLKANRLLYCNTIDKEELHALVKAQIWKYDIAGYITHQDLKSIIAKGFILPKHSMLNAKIPMDAENYYIQSGDMKDFKQLVATF